MATYTQWRNSLPDDIDMGHVVYRAVNSAIAFHRERSFLFNTCTIKSGKKIYMSVLSKGIKRTFTEILCRFKHYTEKKSSLHTSSMKKSTSIERIRTSGLGLGFHIHFPQTCSVCGQVGKAVCFGVKASGGHIQVQFPSLPDVSFRWLSPYLHKYRELSYIERITRQQCLLRGCQSNNWPLIVATLFHSEQYLKVLKPVRSCRTLYDLGE